MQDYKVLQIGDRSRRARDAHGRLSNIGQRPGHGTLVRHEALAVVVKNRGRRQRQGHVPRKGPGHIRYVDVDLAFRNTLQAIADQHGRQLNGVAIVEQRQRNDAAELRKEALVAGLSNAGVSDRPVSNRTFHIAAVAHVI